MALFGKKVSFSGMKDKLVNSAVNLKESISNIEGQTVLETIKEKTVSTSAATAKLACEAYDVSKTKAVAAYGVASDEVKNFDYSQLSDKSFYQSKYSEYSTMGAEKINETWRSTFEVDKSTLEMVEDVRRRLPVPAETLDDIFEQCRQEALRRAIASFTLGGVMQQLDDHSADKYNNLSESYKEFKDRSGHHMTADPNFDKMDFERTNAKGLLPNTQRILLEDGYNRGAPLDPLNADIEHVVAKKEYFDDFLIRMGTTDDEFYTAINSADNLVFANSSLNRSMGATDINVYLEQRGRPDPDNPKLVHVDIEQKDGLVKTVTVNIDDVKEAHDRAKEKQNQHRMDALQEIGITVVKTGTAMAVQQITGLIVVETIDIFIDEIRSIARDGKLINNEGWIKNAQQRGERITTRLTERFEQRDLWKKAQVLGVESGLAGALSVIPQILISMITKMPSFILAITRECTLSTVRCVRILSSNEQNKLGMMQVILAGSASAIVGVYVGRVISNAIAPVPLLNKFNREVTSILTGLMVTAVPLMAIYAFERNKNQLSFLVSKIKNGEPT
ncbi:MAG: hypothetical protein WBF70_01670 [Aeromonas molluscorum]